MPKASATTAATAATAAATTTSPVPADNAAVEADQAAVTADQTAVANAEAAVSAAEATAAAATAKEGTDEAKEATDVTKLTTDDVTTTPPPQPTFTANPQAAGSTSMTVNWANGAPTKIGRNGVDQGGFGAWDTTMETPPLVPGVSGSVTFTALVPGDTYTATAYYLDGSTLTVTETIPAAVTPPPNNPGQTISLPQSFYTGTPTVLANFNLKEEDDAQAVPYWYSDGQTQNGTKMLKANVLYGTTFSDGSVGVRFVLQNDTGGILSSSPYAGANPGFVFAPSAGKGVFVQFRRNAPATSSGQVADWIELWTTGGNANPVPGSSWQDEIDVDEGLGGTDQGHTHWNEGATVGSGNFTIDDTGWHIVGCLWTETSVTWIYDGKQIGEPVTVPATSDPQWVVCGTSLGSGPVVQPSNLDVSDIVVWEVTLT